MQVYHMCLKLFTRLWQAGWFKKKNCCFCNKKHVFAQWQFTIRGRFWWSQNRHPQNVPSCSNGDTRWPEPPSRWLTMGVKSCPIQRTIFGWFEVHWWLRKYHESHHISIRLKSYRLHLSESAWTPLQRCRCGECFHLGLSRGYTPTYGSLNEENDDKTWW